MTAIAALIDREKGCTYLASDSKGSNTHTGHNYKTKKLFKNNFLSFAGCGSYRAIQLIEHKLFPREFKINESIDEYVFKYLIDELKEIFKKGGFLKKDSEVERIESAKFIIAVKDRLYVLQRDLAILEPENIFCALGSGEYHVESSIYTQLKLNKRDYRTILKTSIKITSEIVLSVGGKVHILEHRHK